MLDKERLRWIRNGLRVEVVEGGKRWVSWDYNKGCTLNFKWNLRVTISKKIDGLNSENMGLGPNFISSLSVGLNDQRNGPYFSPILLGPSTYEVGECSKAGQVSLVPKLAVARQCSRILEHRAILISDGVCLFGLTLTTKGQVALTLWSVSFL